MENDRDLRIYAFENALSILRDSIQVFSKDKIEELFNLADKIYNYLNNGRTQ